MSKVVNIKTSINKSQEMLPRQNLILQVGDLERKKFFDACPRLIQSGLCGKWGMLLISIAQNQQTELLPCIRVCLQAIHVSWTRKLNKVAVPPYNILTRWLCSDAEIWKKLKFIPRANLDSSTSNDQLFDYILHFYSLIFLLENSMAHAKVFTSVHELQQFVLFLAIQIRSLPG